ncbi:MAG TPA: septal ring lytic transglycosylase RlpA family protein [Casimicrobium sp.]|nr:septal ring lytic transglycosylase RlpA family protein [Casimicrobium sp.]
MTLRITASFSVAVLVAALLSGCASKPSTKSSSGTPTATASPSARSGAYYKDDGPAASLPADIDRIPDAAPRAEPLHRFANRPYNVFGVDYAPMTVLAPLKQRGIASWYGKKFHGQKTAIGETYDMFAMTAAHPTAPLPCFARVTHARSGRSVIVRINDRGPFHPGRIVDLSYAAAHRLGIAQGGSGEVEFEILTPPFGATPSMQTPVLTSPIATPALVEPPPLNAQTPSRETFYVQLGAFGNFANAQTFQQRLSAESTLTPRVQQVEGLFRVRLGPFDSRAAADAARVDAQALLGTRSPLPIISGNVR